MDSLAGQHLRLQKADGSLLAFIDTSMPESMQMCLQHNLEVCFLGPSLIPTDSSEGGTEFNFMALHLSHYNRHTTMVSTIAYFRCVCLGCQFRTGTRGALSCPSFALG